MASKDLKDMTDDTRKEEWEKVKSGTGQDGDASFLKRGMIEREAIKRFGLGKHLKFLNGDQA